VIAVKVNRGQTDLSMHYDPFVHNVRNFGLTVVIVSGHLQKIIRQLQNTIVKIISNAIAPLQVCVIDAI